MPNTAQVKGSVIPYLTVDGALKAAKFYEKAFGAELAANMPPDDKGRTMHVHLYVNGGSLMLGDAFPEHGQSLQKPAAFSVTLPVQDVDTWFKRAVEAGCTSKLAPQDMFWGDRFASVADPFGVSWGFNGPVKKA